MPRKYVVPKSADIVGLYLNQPLNALVNSVDETPGIQALERAVGYVETENSKIACGDKNTYRRHGTLNFSTRYFEMENVFVQSQL